MKEKETTMWDPLHVRRPCEDCYADLIDSLRPIVLDFSGSGKCRQCLGSGEAVLTSECEICSGTGRCQTCGGSGEVEYLESDGGEEAEKPSSTGKIGSYYPQNQTSLEGFSESVNLGYGVTFVYILLSPVFAFVGTLFIFVVLHLGGMALQIFWWLKTGGTGHSEPSDFFYSLDVFLDDSDSLNRVCLIISLSVTSLFTAVLSDGASSRIVAVTLCFVFQIAALSWFFGENLLQILLQ